MGGLHYDITLTTAQARQQLRQIQESIRQTAAQIESAGVDIDNATESMSQGFNRVAGTVAAAFGAKELVSRLTKIRGEFQQLEVAFNTMLGSADKANTLLQQLTRTAAITPFGMNDVANGAKQLLAYGFAAENVNDTLIRLGDIAAGLSIPLGDLVYLYGTTMAQGRLYTQDLNQFTGRGIPMISELAKQFGVAEGKVKGLVEAGKIGFPEVQKVVESLTNEGGKFGGLMAEQSKTITGQISNIEDAIDMMFNNLGKQSEGVINATLSGVGYVVENYERFGRTLLGIIGTYGAYRAALILNAATVGWVTKAEALHYNWLLLVEKAQKVLNASMLTNPYVLMAAAVAAVGVALLSMKTESERLKEATENYNKTIEDAVEKEQEYRRELEKLIDIASDEALSTDTRREALQKLEAKYPSVFEKYKTEYELLKNIKDIKQQIAEIEDNKSITNPKNELNSVEAEIARLEALKETTDIKGIGAAAITTTRELTFDEQAKLKALKIRRDELKKTIRQDEVDSYFANLTGISNEQLEAQIKTRKDLLAKMELSGAKTGRLFGFDKTAGSYTSEQIQSQIQQLERELNARNDKRLSSSSWAAKAEKDYQKALKAYNDFLTNPRNNLTAAEFEEQAKALKEAAETAKKERDKYQTKSDKATENAAKKRLESEKKISEELAEVQKENEATAIELMKDGTAKRLKEIRHDFDVREYEIKKLESEWREKNKKAGRSSDLTSEQSEKLAEARRLNEERRNAETRKIYDDLANQYQSYTDKRLSIEKQFNQDIKALEDARRGALNNGDTETADKYARAIAKATSEKGKALMSYDFERLQQSPEYVRAFEDLRSTSTETLNALIKQFEAAKTAASTSLNPQDLREYTTAIQAMNDELDRRNPFEALTRQADELAAAETELTAAERRLNAVRNGAKIAVGLQEVGKDADGKPQMVATYLTLEQALNDYTKAKDKHRQADNKYTKAEEAAKASVTELTTAIKNVGSAIGGTAGEIVDLIFNIGTFVTDTIDGIKTVQKTGTDAVSAVEKASVILALISTAIQLLKAISDLGNGAFKEYEAFAEKMDEINALTDATNQYRLAVLEARQAEDSWFAEDGLKNLRAWKEYHDEVYKAYIDKATEAQAIYKNESGGGWLTGSLNWIIGNLSSLSWWDEWRELLGQSGYDKNTTAAVNNLRIETRKKSSGLLGTGIGGKSQKTEDLTEWARKNGLGELFDDKGLINKELAQALIDNYGNKLVGQTKETLEALIELREQYDKYIEQLHEYVSSLYEPLVDNFVDSLWDWLDEGKSALDSFKKYASDTFRDIVSDMLRSIVLEKVVGSFSDDISAIYEKYADGEATEEELMQAVANLTSGLLGRYEANLPTLENVLENVYGMLNEAGIDLKNGSTTQQATAGGFTTISEDTGQELNGRFTAFAESNQSIADSMLTAITSMNGIAESVTNSNGTLRDMLEQSVASNEYLRDIAKQTKPLLKLNDQLDSLIKNTK